MHRMAMTIGNRTISEWKAARLLGADYAVNIDEVRADDLIDEMKKFGACSAARTGSAWEVTFERGKAEQWLEKARKNLEAEAEELAAQVRNADPCSRNDWSRLRAWPGTVEEAAQGNALALDGPGKCMTSFPEKLAEALENGGGTARLTISQVFDCHF